MKKINAFILGFLLVFAPPAALAAKKAIDAQEDASVQLLKNPGFESGKAGWTSSGGTFTILTGGSALAGGATGRFVSSGSGQTLKSPGMVLNSSLKPGGAGSSFGFSCETKTTGADWLIQALEGSTVIAQTTVAPSSALVRQQLIAPVTAGNTYSVQLKSQSSGTIDTDNCRIEDHPTFGISQASIVGTAYVPATSGCLPTIVSGTLSGYSPSSSCPANVVETNPGPGTIAAVDADGPSYIVNNLPPGDYMAIMDLAISGNVTQVANLAISDGVNTRGAKAFDATTDSHSVQVAGHFSYTSTANHTYALFGAAGGTLTINGAATTLSASSGMRFTLYRFPSASQEAFAMDTVAQTATVNISGANWTHSGAMGDPTVVGTPVLSVDQNTNSGTIVEDGTNPGVTVPIGGKGTYEVCFQTSFAGSGASNTQLLEMQVDGVGIARQAANTTVASPMSICRVWDSPDAASHTFKLQMQTTGGTTATLAGETYLRFSIVKLTQQKPAPVFVGGVNHPGAGVVEVVYGYFGQGSINTICTAGTCSVFNSNISGIVVTHTGTGQYTVVFPSGTFSIPPVCMSTPGPTTGGYTTQDPATWTSNTVVISDAAGDTDMFFSCTGLH